VGNYEEVNDRLQRSMLLICDKCSSKEKCSGITTNYSCQMRSELWSIWWPETKEHVILRQTNKLYKSSLLEIADKSSGTTKNLIDNIISFTNEMLKD
jgi:hypothetical protein